MVTQDGVGTALELVLQELAGVESLLAERGSAAFKEREYGEAENLIEAASRVQEFRARVQQLHAEWDSGRFVEDMGRSERNPGSKRAPRAGTRSSLRVTLPTGEVLQGRTAAETFVDAIQYLGVGVVERLGISISGVPLVSRTPHERYNQQHVGAKYIMTHSSTASKRVTLLDIARRLDKQIEVEIV